MIKYVFFIFTILSFSNAHASTLSKLGYSCEEQAGEHHHYRASPNAGSQDHAQGFQRVTRIFKHCRQLPTSSEPQESGTKQDAEHLIQQNDGDHGKGLIKASTPSANIVKQASLFSHNGIWGKTEELTKCWQDKGTVEVWGGMIHGDDTNNNPLIASYGAMTPNFLWKVIRFPDGEVNSWLIPNSNETKANPMDAYLVAPATLEALTGLVFNMPYAEKAEKDLHSKPMPSGCSLG